MVLSLHPDKNPHAKAKGTQFTCFTGTKVQILTQRTRADAFTAVQQAFEHLSRITGRPAPRFQVPYGVALAAAHVDELLAKLTGKPPKAPLAGVRMAAYKMWFNPAKAIRELGLPQTNPVQALADAVTWFEQNGYVKSR